MVQAGQRQERLHRLVAEAFIPNPANLLEVNHLDGNKLNNNADNLEWVTHAENMRHAVVSGLHSLPSGERARNAKLKQSDVDYIRNTYEPRKKGRTLRDLGNRFGVTEQCVFRIVKRITWPEAA
jgi:hypothetical protein